MLSLSRTSVLRSTLSLSTRRTMSSGPKMHKATDKWTEFVKQRPPKDHLDSHLMFHPPYNGVNVGLGILAIYLAGYGVIHYGISHQQYKQGYWKK